MNIQSNYGITYFLQQTASYASAAIEGIEKIIKVATECFDYLIRTLFLGYNEEHCSPFYPIAPQFRNVQDILDKIDRAYFTRWGLVRDAIKWANEKLVRIDTEHPYFEIIQKAFEYRLQIPGGRECSPDFRADEYIPNGRVSPNQFRYVIHTLVGFQELSRVETQELLKKLDNKGLQNNPAYKFAWAISKITTYPVPGGDIRGKLQIGLEAAFKAYSSAKEKGQLLKYFNEGFVADHICFDARVSNFQNLILDQMHPHFEDFNTNHLPNSPFAIILCDHYRVFRNLQIMRFVRETPDEHLSYESFKMQIVNEMKNPCTRAFHRLYYTREQFADYLKAKGDPIKVSGKVIEERVWRPVLDDLGF